VAGLQQTLSVGLLKIHGERREEFMKKFLLAGAAFGVLMGPAMGADVLEPVYRAPAFAWTGFYAGLNAGYTFNANNSTTTSTNTFFFPGSGPLAQAITSLANSTVPITNDGFVGGGQVGYNYQVAWFATSLVAGVEADIQAVSGKGSSSFATTMPVATFPAAQCFTAPPPKPRPCNLNQTAAVSSSIDYLGTLRGRLGILVGFLGTTVLYYATGGLAYGGVSASTTVTQSVTGPNVLIGLTPPTWTGSGAFSGTRFGFAAGLGAEWLFFPNWSTSFEWLHYDLGTLSYGLSSLVSNAGPTRPYTVNTLAAQTPFSGEILRAAVNYHF
jgi:outer membrane immunogenic protein